MVTQFTTTMRHVVSELQVDESAPVISPSSQLNTERKIIVPIAIASAVLVCLVSICICYRRFRNARRPLTTEKSAKLGSFGHEDFDFLSDGNLLFPPAAISTKCRQGLYDALSGMLDDAEPEVFVCFAVGQRSEDVTNSGPELCYAAAVVMALHTRGIRCNAELPGTSESDASFTMLSETGVPCKSLVVVETRALYSSRSCLEQIYTAQAMGIEVTRLRFEAEAAEYPYWFCINEDDTDGVTMMKSVAQTFRLLTPFPAHPEIVQSKFGFLCAFALNLQLRLMGVEGGRRAYVGRPSWTSSQSSRFSSLSGEKPVKGGSLEDEASYFSSEQDRSFPPTPISTECKHRLHEAMSGMLDDAEPDVLVETEVAEPTVDNLGRPSGEEATDFLSEENLFFPPAAISTECKQRLHDALSGMLDDAEPEVFVCYAVGQRSEDVTNSSPELCYAVAVVRALHTRGIRCNAELPGTSERDASFTMLSETGLSCKSLVVVETRALYSSRTCLEQIYTALAMGIEVTRLRFEADAAHGYLCWPCINEDDTDGVTMMKEVVKRFRSLAALPARPDVVQRKSGFLSAFALSLQLKLLGLEVGAAEPAAKVVGRPSWTSSQSSHDGGNVRTRKRKKQQKHGSKKEEVTRKTPQAASLHGSGSPDGSSTRSHRKERKNMTDPTPKREDGQNKNAIRRFQATVERSNQQSRSRKFKHKRYMKPQKPMNTVEEKIIQHLKPGVRGVGAPGQVFLVALEENGEPVITAVGGNSLASHPSPHVGERWQKLKETAIVEKQKHKKRQPDGFKAALRRTPNCSAGSDGSYSRTQRKEGGKGTKIITRPALAHSNNLIRGLRDSEERSNQQSSSRSKHQKWMKPQKPMKYLEQPNRDCDKISIGKVLTAIAQKPMKYVEQPNRDGDKMSIGKVLSTIAQKPMKYLEQPNRDSDTISIGKVLSTIVRVFHQSSEKGAPEKQMNHPAEPNPYIDPSPCGEPVSQASHQYREGGKNCKLPTKQQRPGTSSHSSYNHIHDGVANEKNLQEYTEIALKTYS